MGYYGPSKVHFFGQRQIAVGWNKGWLHYNALATWLSMVRYKDWCIIIMQAIDCYYYYVAHPISYALPWVNSFRLMLVKWMADLSRYVAKMIATSLYWRHTQHTHHSTLLPKVINKLILKERLTRRQRWSDGSKLKWALHVSFQTFPHTPPNNTRYTHAKWHKNIPILSPMAKVLPDCIASNSWRNGEHLFGKKKGSVYKADGWSDASCLGDLDRYICHWWEECIGTQIFDGSCQCPRNV